MWHFATSDILYATKDSVCICEGLRYPTCVLIQTLEDEPAPVTRQHLWQNRPLSEWTNLQVCHWLMGMNMDQYIAEFTAKGIDGKCLADLDSGKLKVRIHKEYLHYNMQTWPELNKMQIFFFL